MTDFEHLVTERAGSISMCWSKTPKGEFNSSLCMRYVADIIRSHEEKLKESERRGYELVFKMIGKVGIEGIVFMRYEEACALRDKESMK